MQSEKMKKIIFDTNVVVSSLIQRGYPYRIMYEHFIGGKIQLCISEPLLQEYIEVLRRDKFSRFPDFFVKAEALLISIKNHAVLYSPRTTIDIIADKADNRVLELAAESHADFLITGNTSDFTFPVYEVTKIVSPRKYWEQAQLFQE
jgi:putative PIN family toxin of toxin-antitoxin system